MIFRLFKGLLMSVTFLAYLLVNGCTQAPETGDDDINYPYKIVTTIGQITDIAREVAGDKARVKGLMGPGIDPHLYMPTRSDVAAMMEADIIFYCGLLLEGKMTDVFVRIARQGKPVYAVTELIDQDYLLQPEEFEGQFDPHLWMDVRAWKRAVNAVTRALGDFDPAHAEIYEKNAEEYLTKLEELHEYAERVLGTVPEDRRILVTAHDAFNYFGRAYEFDVRGIQGITTDSEAGLQDINRLIDLIVERDIGAVFIETSVAEKNVRALIEGARSRGADVRIGGTLFSDAMGASGTYEGTYVGMIDHNVTTITRALGGEAPERGLHGKLRLIEKEEKGR